MELRCLLWRTVWFWRAHILIVIIDFGSGFFCCKVVRVLEGEVWQLITQHSRILSLSINVGKKKRRRSRTQFLSTLNTQLLDKMLRLCEKVIVMKRMCMYTRRGSYWANEPFVGFAVLSSKRRVLSSKQSGVHVCMRTPRGNWSRKTRFPEFRVKTKMNWISFKYSTVLESHLVLLNKVTRVRLIF